VLANIGEAMGEILTKSLPVLKGLPCREFRGGWFSMKLSLDDLPIFSR
jgi:hypothetical protein